MARPIDLSSLTKAERLVLVAAMLGFANGFGPWWFRVETSDGVFRYNAGLSTLSFVAVLIAGITAVLVVARAAIWPQPAPAIDGFIYGGLGSASVGLLVAEAARTPAGWLGLLAGLFLAIVQAAAGLRRWEERRSGWT